MPDQWTIIVTTCTESGKDIKNCKRVGCSYEETQNIITALGHDWIDNWQTTAPTCTETGGDKRTCNRINCTETQSKNETTALGHTQNTETGICTVCNALTYNLGDTGPGGGKIFYRSETGFTMTDDNSTAYYLEAAPEDITTLRTWSSNDFIPSAFYGTGDWVFISDTKTEIGTGRNNTVLILTIDDLAPAALACVNYNNGDKTDWFLPSRNELEMLYINKAFFDNLNGDEYWSSSQYQLIEGAWCLLFNWWNESLNGGLGNYYKSNTHPVRAIRAF